MSTSPPIAVLISGAGRTLKNLIDLAESGQLPVDIRIVVSSAPAAGGLKFAEAAGIDSLVVRRGDYADDEAFSDAVLAPCRNAGVEYIVMAGFLRFLHIPPDFANRVLNIHPALLPAFGGPGMYGHHVHDAVLASRATESGCTIHFVDNKYDHGPIIYQKSVPVLRRDTAETLAARVFAAEKEAYPIVLRRLAAGDLGSRIVRS